MNIPQTDRRAPHREDRAEALRNFYHPDDERRQDLVRLNAWIAELQAEAPHADVVPLDETAFWRDVA